MHVKTLSVVSVSSDSFGSKQTYFVHVRKHEKLCCLMKHNELRLYIISIIIDLQYLKFA